MIRRIKKQSIIVVLLIVLASALLYGCATDTPSNEPASSGSETTQEVGLSVTDMTGRQVDLSGPATKVVALTAAECEIVYALGAGDTVVGRGEFCNYPAEALEVTAVESGSETNIEQIVALAPDVVLMSTMAQSEEQIAQLENAGIAVFVSEAKNIEETYQAISLIGTIMGKETEASKIVSDMKATFADLSAKVAAAEGSEATPKSIYFEVSPLEYGLWTAGSDTFMDEVAVMLGLENIFSDISGWAEVSEEQILQRNPDFILTVGMYFGDGPTPVESILSRGGWEDVTAVKNKALLNLQEDELSRPGPRLAEGARLVYELVYG